MLVYGDHERTVDPGVELAVLQARAAALADAPKGLAWHSEATRLFIAAAGLAQGMADAAFAAAGVDEHAPIQAAAMEALVALAGALDRSWSSGFADQALGPSPSGEGLGWRPSSEPYARGDAPPRAPPLKVWGESELLADRVTIRRCEGYAYYALYPELTLAAARQIPKGAVVIGLRSIGTGLAALAAAVCDAAFVCTVRPIGDVFARTLALGPGLTETLQALRDRPFVLVDEGPGLSGSSFGGAADALEALGVTRILFLPSHAGDLGPQATPAHRQRWQSATRPVARFEDVIEPHLAGWFADVTGEATAPLHDGSGGAWRTDSPYPHAPIDPNREARKYRLTTARGRFLLKFVGLDDAAAAKLERARALHAAGFGPEPLALRHGILCERWIESDRLASQAAIVATLPAYLAFRARAFPAEQGASLAELVAMARHNLADVPGSAALLDAHDVAALRRHVRPVHVDARLHRWEWIAGVDGLRKTDALDHAQAHDLVGPQDIAWDVAGAIAEYGCDPAPLIAAAMPDRPKAAALVACLLPCYLGFQRGWWSYAPDGADQSARYAAKAAALAAG